MTGMILTLNAGSSSIKLALFAPGAPPERRAEGHVEEIGGDARLHLALPDGTREDHPLEGARDHRAALAAMLDPLETHLAGGEVAAVGHRIVHGGREFAAPARLDDAALERLAALSPFAPLHQPHNLAGVRAARATFPEAMQYGCFDTAFHRDQPELAELFALPREFAERGVRRYGFHGLNYEHVMRALAETAPEAAAGRVIVAHLGNGASMAAVKGGRPAGSTMGLTALDGLAMGTRSGRLDPGVLLYLIEHEGWDAASLTDLLYRRSGLLGLSGLSSDMRELEEAGTPEAEQAIALFCHRVRCEAGSLAAALEGLDALVFTGGIGEHSARVRREVCAGLGWLGVVIEPGLNDAAAPVISATGSGVGVHVIPADEEMTIARAAARLASC